MRELTSESPEYSENGYYVIEGVDYYSVWTFKKLFRNNIDNSKEKNTQVTNSMNVKYGLPPFKGLMEIGDYKGEFVQLHKKEDLEDFLPKKRFIIGDK